MIATANQPSAPALAVQSQRPESYMLEDIELRKSAVAPSDIMILPPGLSMIPDDTGRWLQVQNYNGVLSEVLSESLQRTNRLAASGKGRPAFIDPNHDRVTIAGLVHDVWWGGPRGGTRAAVSWLPAMDREVAAGHYHSFSPALLFSNRTIAGFLGANIGAILSRGQLPQFSAMAPIKAITKREDLVRQHARFVDLLIARGTTSETLDQNVAQLRADRPDLVAGYDFCEGLKAERAAVNSARVRAAERQRQTREQAELQSQSAEFIRRVDARASVNGRLDTTRLAAAKDSTAADHPELYQAYRLCHP